MAEHSEALASRFWSKVDKTAGNDGCWLWTGPTHKGYGHFNAEGQKFRAHRFAVELSGRDIPDGLVVDHMCRVRNCVNPSHLRVVTVAVNATENSDSVGAIYKRATHCVNGHEWSPENTLMYEGWRRCRACLRDHAKRAYLKKHPNVGPRKPSKVKQLQAEILSLQRRLAQVESALNDATDLLEQRGFSTVEHRAALNPKDTGR